MELIVGTNSYVTLNEANELVERFSGTEIKLKELWKSIESEEREALIYSTTLKYDNYFEYYGRKLDKNQKLQFPRINDCKEILECPEEIKIGLLIQGIRDYKESSSKMADMREQGVTSYKVEGSSITWDNKQSSIKKLSGGVYMDVYLMYIRPYTITI